MTVHSTTGTADISDLILFLISLIFVAFFAAYEIAYITIERSKLRLWFKGKMARYLTEYPERILTANLLGTNISSVSAAVFMTRWMIHIVGTGWAAGIAGILTTLTIVLFGEIIPKDIGRRKRDLVVRYLSWLIFGLYLLSVFFVVPLEKLIRRLVIKDRGMSPETRSKQEIEKLIIRGKESGLLDESSARMLRDALYIYEKQAEKLMITIKTVPALPIDAGVDRFLEVAGKNPESWVLVYRKTLDDIVGYVTDLDIIYARDKHKVIKDLLRPVAFVYAFWTIGRVVQVLKNSDSGVAVVLDEYGGTIGVIDRERILSDLLDALYGYGVKRESPDRYVVDGDTTIEELEDMGINLGGIDEADTISGLIIARLENAVPKEGVTVSIGGYIAIVLEVDESNVIRKVLLEKLEDGDRGGKEII